MTLIIFAFLLLPNIVLAAPATIPLPNPLGTTNILDLGARLIKAGLGITGSLALLFFIYGGFLWLTSGGSPDKIKKGRDVFLWSVEALEEQGKCMAYCDNQVTATTEVKTGCVQDCLGKATEANEKCKIK
ncbi:MAG: hypothetical protein HZC05_00885 [Candidatus Magasanikbacteria bacterium]|nr:hypothetical protein [Candidatus Magasanikbacteria bacterium]